MAKYPSANFALCFAVGWSTLSEPSRGSNALLVVKYGFGDAVERVAGPKISCTARLHCVQKATSPSTSTNLKITQGVDVCTRVLHRVGRFRTATYSVIEYCTRTLIFGWSRQKWMSRRGIDVQDTQYLCVSLNLLDVCTRNQCTFKTVIRPDGQWPLLPCMISFKNLAEANWHCDKNQCDYHVGH